jgi:hypothetical protein
VKYRYVGAFQDDLKPGDIYHAGDKHYVVMRNGVRLINYVVDPSDVGSAGPPGRDGAAIVGPPGRDGSDAEPTIIFCGDWQRIDYSKGSVVVLNGQAWIATTANKSKPGVGKGWSIFAGKGKDGIDGKNIVEYYKRVVVRQGGTSTDTETINALLIDGAASAGVPLYSSPDGMKLARADNGLTTAVSSIAFEAVEPNSQGRVVTEAVITLLDWSAILEDGSANLSPGQTFYLSATVAGKLTHTAPTTPGQFVMACGRALSLTEFDVELSSYPIRL